MQSKTFAIVIAVIMLMLVVELIRRKKMTFKYSIFWLSSCIAVIFLAVNDGLIHRLAKLAGFELVSNFIFFIGVIFFVLLSLMLTIYINEQNNRSETLAQAVGILDYKLRKMESKPQDNQQPPTPIS